MHFSKGNHYQNSLTPTVKSLLRFRCVSKKWRSLISSPKFIAFHSHMPTNSLLIQTAHSDGSGRRVSLLNNLPENPTSAPLRSPIINLGRCRYAMETMDVVGCANGMVCLSLPPSGNSVIHWNPATGESKVISFPAGTTEVPPCIRTTDVQFSIGFGYDGMVNDFKIVTLLCHSPEPKFPLQAKVYSVKFGNWRKKIFYLDIWIHGRKCDAVISGGPVWIASAQREGTLCELLMLYNGVNSSCFCEFPMSVFEQECSKRVIEWKGSPAVLAWDESEKLYFDLFRLGSTWSKKLYIGPIFGVERIVGCSGYGKIIVENDEGNFVLYDTETKQSTTFVVDGAKEGCSEVFSYKESLISLICLKEICWGKFEKKPARKTETPEHAPIGRVSL